MASSVLTSKRLIDNIKRRAFIPRSQETFTNDEFLERATDEINIGIMDQILMARGDYLVYFVDVPLVASQFSYEIPSRAQGNKLRDAAIVDPEGKAIFELAQISIEELSDYSNYYNITTRNAAFYLQNNMVVLTGVQGVNASYSLRMWFYMRPNSLVLDERAATAATMSTTFEIDTISPKSGTITNISLANPTVITSVAHGLVGGDKIIIAGSDSTPSVDGLQTVTYIDPDTFSIPVDVTTTGTSGSWNLAAEVTVIASALIPKNFTTDIQYDVVGAKSPNKIKLYDLFANNVNTTVKTISFRTVDTKGQISIGDYITQMGETIVPNIPTEYHPILAQRVALSCLESMNDELGYAKADKKLKEMEKSALRMIFNRVEGAPKKLKQRHGTLNQTLGNRLGRRW